VRRMPEAIHEIRPRHHGGDLMSSTDITPVDAAKRIRDLNDAFRTTFVGGVITLTEGVDALRPEVKAEVLKRVREFDRFTEDNDPHGEHNFGSFEIGSQLVHGIAFNDLAFELPGDHESHDRQGGVGAFDVRLIPIRFPEVPAFGSVLDRELGQGVGAFDVLEHG
jgi:hypothetical protein